MREFDFRKLRVNSCRARDHARDRARAAFMSRNAKAEKFGPDVTKYLEKISLLFHTLTEPPPSLSTTCTTPLLKTTRCYIFLFHSCLTHLLTTPSALNPTLFGLHSTLFVF